MKTCIMESNSDHDINNIVFPKELTKCWYLSHNYDWIHSLNIPVQLSS